MTVFGYTPSQVRKAILNFVVFLLTLGGVLVENNVLPGDWLIWYLVFVGLAGAYGVYRVPNAPVGRHVDHNRPVV